MPKIAKAYAITDAKISFVSLVDKAANKKQFLMGFAIKQTGFSYPKVPDVEDVACHFNVNANAELTQTESANEFIYSGKLQLPAGTDVRVNDKVVDKNTGLAYTAEMPHNIRDHHIMVNIQRKGTVKGAL